MNHSTCNREDLERLRVPDLKAEAKSKSSDILDMDNKTCRQNLMKLSRKELKSKLRKRCHWGFSNLCKAELINLLVSRREGEDESRDGDPLEVLSSRRKDLMKICKERKIKYARCMTKQQMIEVLKWNDEDQSVNIHPDVQKKVLERINDPDKREKARERTRRWQMNNPEKTIEHLKKWQESLRHIPPPNPTPPNPTPPSSFEDERKEGMSWEEFFNWDKVFYK